jgi:hypothetical protein
MPGEQPINLLPIPHMAVRHISTASTAPIFGGLEEFYAGPLAGPAFQE